jgi:hypothetical protein
LRLADEQIALFHNIGDKERGRSPSRFGS